MSGSMDLYRLLATSAPTAVETGAPGGTRPRSGGVLRRNDPRPWPMTSFTEAVESTDEERSGALLGSVAP